MINKNVLAALNSLGIGIDKGNNTQIETNANEQMHTGNTGFGAELVPAAQLSQEVFETLPKYSSFLDLLPGFHGYNLPMSIKKPMIGEAPFFKGASEHTDAPFTIKSGTRLATADVQLDQKKFDMQIDISEELKEFNVLGADKFLAKIKEKIGASMTRTIEALIINGDIETGATGNVNSDDEAPAATDYFLKADGLRKVGLAEGGLDVGTLDFADFIALTAKLGDYAGDPASCLWLLNGGSYTKALTIAEFLTASTNGKSSTVFDGSITNILGSDVRRARDLGKTEADGKKSYDTPANNVKGNILYFWLPAVQYGFGSQGLNVKLFDWGSQGVQLDCWFFLALKVIKKITNVITDATVANGYNITN